MDGISTYQIYLLYVEDGVTIIHSVVIYYWTFQCPGLSLEYGKDIRSHRNLYTTSKSKFSLTRYEESGVFNIVNRNWRIVWSDLDSPNSVGGKY